MKHDEYEFVLVSNTGHVITNQYGAKTEFWAQSLSVAVINRPTNSNLTDLLFVSKRLLSKGFFGWVIAETYPQNYDSWTILQPHEVEGSPKGTQVILSLAFKVMLPEVLR